MVNFQVQPFVEVEDVFVSKAVRSLQLKLRECLVIPPVERMQHRFSVCFPERVCSSRTIEEEGDEVNTDELKRPAPVSDDPAAKRPCCNVEPVVVPNAENEDDAVEEATVKAESDPASQASLPEE